MSKKSVKYVLIIIGLLIFLATYFLVFIDFSDKTDALNTEITALNQKLDQVNGYFAEIATYKSSIEEDKLAVNSTLSKYNSVDTPEDFIMFAIDLEDKKELDVNALSFTKPTPIYTIMAVKDTDDYTVPLEPTLLTGYKVSSTMSSSMNYDQMKAALDFIYSQKTVTVLDSLSINFDSATGLILGNMIIDKYFVTGRDIQAHQAVVPYTDIGKSVLIGS